MKGIKYNTKICIFYTFVNNFISQRAELSWIVCLCAQYKPLTNNQRRELAHFHSHSSWPGPQPGPVPEPGFLRHDPLDRPLWTIAALSGVLSICPSLCLSVCLSVCVSVCPIVWLYAFLVNKTGASEEKASHSRNIKTTNWLYSRANAMHINMTSNYWDTRNAFYTKNSQVYNSFKCFLCYVWWWVAKLTG